MYVLDTDTISFFLKGYSINIVSKFRCTPFNSLATTIINYSELYYGIALNPRRTSQNDAIKEFLATIQILKFTKTAAEIFAIQKARNSRLGSPIADLDLMVACIALSNNSVLITNNTKHFSRIKELQLENWL
jgi:tRNA(fMet)-specific endonuclease VapC